MTFDENTQGMSDEEFDRETERIIAELEKAVDDLEQRLNKMTWTLI